MNTEDFVTYEQALALKKLGFKEECLYHYNKDGILFSNSDSDGAWYIYQEEDAIVYHDVIDCGINEDLFFALVSLPEETDISTVKEIISNFNL